MRRNDTEIAYEWMSHPVVARGFLRTMGVRECGSNVSLTNPSSELVEVLDRAEPAYAVVSNESILHDKNGRSPARSMLVKDIPYSLQYNPLSDIGMSIRSRKSVERNGEPYPKSIVFFLDIEAFDHFDSSRMIIDQLGQLREIEDTYQLISAVLREYNVPFSTTLTGRGYHFYFRVDGNSAAMRSLISIGQHIEPELQWRHATDHQRTKRQNPIHLNFERAFKGASVLQQFLATTIQRRSRDQGKQLLFSDSSARGIVIDNTSLLRHAGNAKVMVSPGFWLKSRMQPWKYSSSVQESRMITRIPRSHAEVGCEDDLEKLVHARQNFNAGLKYVDDFSVGIPDASDGIQELSRKYWDSDLFRLQQDMDRFSELDHVQDWDATYRNYAGIKQSQFPNNSRMQHLFEVPYPSLLQPQHLEYFINALIDVGWPPIHIVGLLTAMYEDPRIEWKGFERHDSKIRRAWGWVYIILSQALLGK